MPDANETTLEKTFSDLAYSHLRDKAQGLLDYLVGFQMLKQEDDGQRAVGIFGFEIDKDFYYAPVFFLNGEIRGLDSLYSIKSDLFTPLTDDWVNSIINRRQQVLGEPNTQTRSQRGVHVPNYTRLKVIPGGAGAVNLKLAQDNVVAAMIGQNSKLAACRVDLCQTLRETGVGPTFQRALDANPRLQEAFEKFGYSSLDLMPEISSPLEKKAAAEKALIIINKVTDAGVEDLTDKQREEILAGGAVVMDKRPEVMKAFVYPTETQRVIENPTAGGLYDVVWSDGTTTLTLVCPVTDGSNKVFVYCTESEMYGEIDRRRVWTVRRYERQALVDWLEKNAQTPSDTKNGQVVVFVSSSGESTGGFCIKDRLIGVDGLTVLQVRDRHLMECGSIAGCVCPSAWDDRGANGNPRPNAFCNLSLGGTGDHDVPQRTNRPEDPTRRVEQIIVQETGTGKPAYTRKQLIVNDKCFWALVINRFTEKVVGDTFKDQIEEYDEPNWDSQLKIGDFGDPNTVCAAIEKVSHAIKTWRQGNEVNIKVGEAVDTVRTLGDGLRVLMGKYGMAEQSAREIWEAATYSPTTRWFKAAAQLLEMPEAEDTDLGGFLTSFHRQQVPFANLNQSQPPLDNRDFYRYFSPYGSGANGEEGGDTAPPNTIEVAHQAAQTGQKDVFDAAALGSLIKSHNPTDLVDRFLPTIISGMDRIGRMLFLIYWHYEDFEERYGEDDLSEFLDNLRSVFEQLGDVIIFAKKRTLAGDPEHYGLGLQPAMEEAS